MIDFALWAVIIMLSLVSCYVWWGYGYVAKKAIKEAYKAGFEHGKKTQLHDIEIATAREIATNEMRQQVNAFIDEELRKAREQNKTHNVN